MTNALKAIKMGGSPSFFVDKKNDYGRSFVE